MLLLTSKMTSLQLSKIVFRTAIFIFDRFQSSHAKTKRS